MPVMASLSSPSPGKPPLRLKDFLKEDTNSDSCGGAAGFRTFPRRLPDHTVRYLLAVELGESADGDRSLGRCRSKGALTKITAVINAVKMLPFVSSTASCIHDCNNPLPKQRSFLSRSFSRRLRRSFWRKREKGDHRVENVSARSAVRVKDIVRLKSFGEERRDAEVAEKTRPRSPPSPVRSTKSSSTSSVGGGWLDTDSAESDLSTSCGSSVYCGEVKDVLPEMDANQCASRRSPYRGIGGDSHPKAACCREANVKQEDMGGGTAIGCPCEYEEEKDQLSPVSVMDYPYEEDDNDDDEEAERAAEAADSPPSFHLSLAKLERTKHQLLQKIREFESLVSLVDPLDLESRFASSVDEPEPANWHEGRPGRGGELHEEDDVDAEADDDQLLQFQVEIEERAHALLRQLQRRGGTKTGGSLDGLLVDFFIERLSCFPHADVDVQIRTVRTKRPCRRTVRAEEEEGETLLRAAEDWMGSRRREDVSSRETGLREMEMDGRWRWPHVEEGEDISGDLEAGVLESLVNELLLDLLQN